MQIRKDVVRDCDCERTKCVAQPYSGTVQGRSHSSRAFIFDAQSGVSVGTKSIQFGSESRIFPLLPLTDRTLGLAACRSFQIRKRILRVDLEIYITCLLQ